MAGRGFCVGIGEILAFAALVLTILVNIGQISQNIVSRNIYYAELDLTNFEATLRAQAGSAGGVSGVYASDQSSPLGQSQGLRNTYQWGLYNYCGGQNEDQNRACVDSSFGSGRFQPAETIYADLPTEYQSLFNQTVSQGTFADSSYLGRFSHAAFYLVFVGTVLAGVTFLVVFLAHRFAFLCAALTALAGAACIGAGAAIYTAILVKARDSIENLGGAELTLNNALWMLWAAFGSLALAIVPLILSCCFGRNKY
ncbi:Actin cortical patch SUR7/pH-response regulator PalI [Ceraceosorus bombacis]|uniref:Actin cortical patch SUR7/pH-response regulator PalI n=1 Tax=Ceraceosorus bombacis TaxID=401625 RepID=A0A0P1BRY3_9BASI|nr:Actin cortical patch SUR7/pH-response regulator PalI [Ceraceosorus bombacis]